MNDSRNTSCSASMAEEIARTLLYEGYALYPYHRSAVKNQKPVPFGVVYPEEYHVHNSHAHAQMQTQCIVTGSGDLSISLTIRFLQLQNKTSENKKLNVPGNQAGWQTVERTINSGDLEVSELLKCRKEIPIAFSELVEIKNGDAGNETSRVISSSAINGTIAIEASFLENVAGACRITIKITNTTPVKNAITTTRDDVFFLSFLSTHTIVKTTGEFISHQNPGEWKSAIEECLNINTWPILMEEGNRTMLSSPIILYDYPRINPQSAGDLFDSTEIEEALLLHVAMLSEDEKKSIAESDEKLQAMLAKVSQVTPRELVSFHSLLKDVQDQ
jgi:hypothetical protein